MPPIAPEDPLVLAKAYPGVTRGILLAGGTFAVVVPALELGGAILPPSFLSLFFGAIILGAWSVGFAFLAGGISGEDLTWRFDGPVLTLDRWSLVRRRVERYTADGIDRTEVRKIDWDSRAPKFSVVVHTRAGEALETPDVTTRGAAEALEADIRRRLGL